MGKDIAIHFAPMQGYTDHEYRRLHASLYGGVDCYYTPFIRVERGQPRAQDMRRLHESVDDGTFVPGGGASSPRPIGHADTTAPGAALVPQVIFNGVEELRILTEAVKDLGFRRIDLNLGCPFPMQTGRGRGAAMLAHAQLMEHVGSFVQDDRHVRYSVKMRLGLQDPDEWRAVLPVLNSIDLEHVAVHPRIAKQMYAGDLYHEQFAEFLGESVNPVIWNGDILSADDIDRITTRYPGIRGVMIGRGMLRRPSLAVEWHTGRHWERDERLAHIMQLHSQLLGEYEARLCGSTQILQKIKPFWDYLEDEIGHKPFKAIRKATSLPRYRAALDTILLRPE